MSGMPRFSRIMRSIILNRASSAHLRSSSVLDAMINFKSSGCPAYIARIVSKSAVWGGVVGKTEPADADEDSCEEGCGEGSMELKLVSMSVLIGGRPLLGWLLLLPLPLPSACWWWCWWWCWLAGAVGALPIPLTLTLMDDGDDPDGEAEGRRDECMADN